MATPTQDRKQMTTSTLAAVTTETVGNEIFDAECLKLINEYFYGVRCILFVKFNSFLDNIIVLYYLYFRCEAKTLFDFLQKL